MVRLNPTRPLVYLSRSGPGISVEGDDGGWTHVVGGVSVRGKLEQA